MAGAFFAMPPLESPWMRLAAIVLGSYVSEDLTLAASSALFARGELDFPVLFAGNVFGIVSGDLAVYGLGRWLGPRVESVPVVGGLFTAERRRAGERWWSRWGAGFLVFSRFFPGTRVVTAFTAGLFEFPVLAAGALFSLLAAVWVAGGAFGFREILSILRPRAALAAGVVFVLAMRAAGSFFASDLSLRDWLRMAYYRLLRLRRFEFWPMWLFYPPVALHYAVLAIRHRSLLLPALANPSIPSGGIIGESKAEILDKISADSPYKLKSLRVDPASEDAAEVARTFLDREGLRYPVILKPDVGQRGSGVRLVLSSGELSAYLSAAHFPVLVQEHCPYAREAGVFYVREPWRECGRVTSLTRKVFPSVVGDGRRTVEQLILDDPRARFIATTYLARFEERRKEVLPPGESLRLVESGNHCQGCVFENGAELITPELAAAVDTLLRRAMPDFHVGRLDVRYESEAALRRGAGFKIVEINGAASEATHIYDAEETLSGAYRSLRGQFDDLFAIGEWNRRERGLKPMTLRRLAEEFWAYKRAQTGHPATS